MRFLCFLVLFPFVALAQHQERKVFAYNTLFGAVTSGIGSIINKPKTENWKAAFAKGLWQGAIGGTINYASKKTLYLVYNHQNVVYTLPAKLLNAAGNSIVENAARHEPFLQNWNIDYGPIRLDFSFNGNRRFTARLLPQSIGAIIEASKNTQFDLKTTLLSGSIVFVYKRGLFYSSGGSDYNGISFGRSLVYSAAQSDSFVHYVIAHEMVHQFQYKEYQVFNSWLKPFEKKVKSKGINKILTKYIYFDIPYFFPAYQIEGSYTYPVANKNYFEFEADRFVTNRLIK